MFGRAGLRQGVLGMTVPDSTWVGGYPPEWANKKLGPAGIWTLYGTYELRRGSSVPWLQSVLDYKSG